MLPLNITPLTSPGICFAGIMLRLWLCYGQRGAGRWIRQGNALLLWSCIVSQTHVLKETSSCVHQLTLPGYANPANQSLGVPGMASLRSTSLLQEPTFLETLNLRPLGSFVLSLD